jgi:hypothetical protein
MSTLSSPKPDQQEPFRIWIEAMAADYRSRGPIVLAEIFERSPIKLLIFVLCAQAQLVPSLEPPPRRVQFGDNLILELAGLSPLEYDRRREAAAEELGVRRGTLDREVEAQREQDSRRPGTDGAALARRAVAGTCRWRRADPVYC